MEGEIEPGAKAVPHTMEGKEWIHPESVAADRKHTLKVLKAGPNHEIVRRNTVEEPVYSSPAIANGRIYIRGEKHLFAIGER